MSFWSSKKIKQKQPTLKLILPFDEERVKHAAYELSLGNQAFITSSKTGKKEIIPKGEQIVIEPGQFGLLITEEIITIPADTIGFISIKAAIKWGGLINVSGFHVDPGFTGRLKFSVYNAGSKNIVLTCGKPLFLIWFSEIDEATDMHIGTQGDMKEITGFDVMKIQGEVASPSLLYERLKKSEARIDTVNKSIETKIDAINNNLEEKMTNLNNDLNNFRSRITTTVIAVMVTVIGGIIVWGLTQFLNNNATTPLQNPINKGSVVQNPSVNANVNIEAPKESKINVITDKKGIKSAERDDLGKKNIDDTQKASSTTEKMLPQPNMIKPN